MSLEYSNPPENIVLAWRYVYLILEAHCERFFWEDSKSYSSDFRFFIWFEDFLNNLYDFSKISNQAVTSFALAKASTSLKLDFNALGVLFKTLCTISRRIWLLSMSLRVVEGSERAFLKSVRKNNEDVINWISSFSCELSCNLSWSFLTLQRWNNKATLYTWPS